MSVIDPARDQDFWSAAMAASEARGMGRPLDSSRSLLGRVVHTVGRKIVGGELPPGAVMPVEAEWGAQMGVSRTVMREATKVLISKGLVESRPKTGTRVRGAEFWNRLDPDVLAWQMAVAPRETFVREIFEFRRTIEPSVAALAATRVTPEQLDGMARALDGMTEAGDDGRQFIGPDLDFHLGILNAVDNGMIRSLSGVIETALTISMYLSLDNPRGQRHSLPLHRAVYDAIRAGEPEGARSAMLRLVDDAEDDAAKAMKTRGVGGTGRNGKSRKG